MPDDHSKLVPLLPIPNRTVKRLCADDSADSRVKVGHRQALTPPNPLVPRVLGGFGFLGTLCFVWFELQQIQLKRQQQVDRCPQSSIDRRDSLDQIGTRWPRQNLTVLPRGFGGAKGGI